VLCGEPGIGKTTLLGYAAERAGSMRVLRATGIESGRELAFGGPSLDAGRGDAGASGRR
jgi:predicted ATP-dependent serine protease